MECLFKATWNLRETGPDYGRFMALRRIRVAALLLVLMCTIGCDQTTKHLARTELGSHQNWISRGGIVELVLAENPGAFLSLGHWLPDFARTSIFVIAVGVLLLGLLVYLIRSGAGVDRITFISLSLL